MTTRTALAAIAGVGVLLGAPLAVARTGEDISEGVRNPSSGDASRETQIIADTARNTYGTRQSNKGAGGGAIYGCRSGLVARAFADPRQSTPCVRVNNLAGGKAFDLVADTSPIVGIIQSGNDMNRARPSVAPFVTNATGVALGLNADRVDGLQASEVVDRARAKPGLDADTVDGLDAAQLRAGACPSDFVAAGGGCLERSAHSAQSYTGAARACAEAGRRLPPPDVLIGAAPQDAIQLGGGELSAEITGAGAVVTDQAVVTVSDGGDVGTTGLGNATAFRCYVG